MKGSTVVFGPPSYEMPYSFVCLSIRLSVRQFGIFLRNGSFSIFDTMVDNWNI